MNSKSINTIPDGVWESTHTDLQGNGYPSCPAAKLSKNSLDKITSLEKEISQENNDNIVLVAYSSNEPN